MSEKMARAKKLSWSLTTTRKESFSIGRRLRGTSDTPRVKRINPSDGAPAHRAIAPALSHLISE
jgi:hypothetical protein